MTDLRDAAPGSAEAGRPNRAAGVALVTTSLFSVQFGAALAGSLFPRLGVLGTVSLRITLAAVALMIFCRPRLRGRRATDWAVIAGFGVALAAMNTLLYGAVARIPLGAAVTIEVLGPLVLSVVVARRAVGWLWAAVALGGVLLLGHDGFAGALDPVGVLCALGAASMWAGYILLSARAGQRFAGLDGLALALSVAAVLVLPAGVATAGGTLLQPVALGLGAAVALLSSLLPYACDLVALRRLHSGSFAIMMSLSPAVASLAGLLVLGQQLTPLAAVAIALVIVASIGAVRMSPAR